MEVNDFCSSLRDEMTGWKEKAYHFISKTDRISPEPDPKLKDSIEDMKDMIDRIEKTLDKLETECPVSWDNEREEIEKTMRELHMRWNDTASYSPDDFE